MYNTKIKTTTIAVLLAVTVLAVFTVPTAFATDYHSGNIWSNVAHTQELHNGKAPLAFTTSELSSNLVLETGTTIAQIYSVMGDAISDIDATDAYLERYDTTTGNYDNNIGTADLADGTLATTYSTTHWFFGSDGHLTQADVDFNHDDYEWDHNGDDSATDTIRMYNVALHEFGHVIGLCDTYTGGNTSWDDCHGVTTSASMMYAYTYGNVETITTSDNTEIDREY